MKGVPQNKIPNVKKSYLKKKHNGVNPLHDRDRK